ncbi:hypothetical protein Tco_0467794 [Tanacetum coccineum]
MLIYAKSPLFLWAEAVATACYTQNCSIIRLRHGKTPYELLHDKLPDLSFLHVFVALCYPTNDNERLDFDELTAMASEHSSLEPALHEMTPATTSSGLMPNPPPLTPFVPGTDNQEKDEKQSQNDKTGLGMEKTFINAHLTLILEAIEEISYYQLIELLAQGIEARAIRTGFLGHSLRKSGLGSETTKIQGFIS